MQRAIEVTSAVPVPVHVTFAVKSSRSPYLDNKKAFILGAYATCRVSFHSMTSTSRVHAGGMPRGKNISTPPKCNILGKVF